jgi:starch-binding outer membrane protein, SusD/RagB family
MNTIMYKIKNVVFAAVALLLLSSCEDWLDLKPENEVIKDDYWKTEQQVHSAVIGCYASMLESGLAERLFLWGELRADMLYKGPLIKSSYSRIMEADIAPDNEVVKWNHFYKTINLCNTVIDNAKLARETDITFTETELKAYEAEALGLRSLLYFYLLRTFGEVPLMVESVTSDQDEFFIAKSPQQVIIDQIIKDLVIAEANAPESYPTNDETRGRLTKYGINALLADVYLWNEEYQNCIDACNKIIESKKYELVGSEQWFDEIFARGNSVESIFELQFSSEKNNPFYNFFSPQGEKYFEGNFLLQYIYNLNDIRGDSATYWSLENNTIWKYIGLSGFLNSKRGSGSSNAHWIFYRYADILLLKAEALNQIGNGKEALDLVHAIQNRARANLSFADTDNKEFMTEVILFERQRELAYEGKRWFDVLRNAKRNNYSRNDILVQMIENSAPADVVDLVISKYSDTRSHYFPIFYEEVEVNDKLEQNPYYNF